MARSFQISTLPSELADHLRRGSELGREGTRGELFPTTVEALDRLLEGGLGRGEMVECIGRRCSGRFSVVLATLAAATGAGEAAALVDLGDHLDPQSASDCGVDLERLLWLRPRHLKQALLGAEVLLGGGFPLVILDLGSPPVPGGRGAEAGWLRLARAAKANAAALLVASPYRVSGTAASAVVALRSGTRRWLGRRAARRLLEAVHFYAALEKFRGRPPRAGESFELLFPTLSLPKSSALPRTSSTVVAPEAFQAPRTEPTSSARAPEVSDEKGLQRAG